jgi:RimJ/RimL family protein N-acetyltransferase
MDLVTMIPHDHVPEIAPELSAPGLRLRPWDYSDAGAVVIIASDDQTRRWSPSLRTVATRADAEAWIRSRLERRTDWAACDVTTSEVVGRIGLHHHDPYGRSAEVGYQVSPARRREGIARRMVEAIVAYAYAPPPEGLGLVRISLQHATGNHASCRTALACGFRAEGLVRHAIPAGADTFDDAHLHGRLAADPPGPAPEEPGRAPGLTDLVPTELVAGRFQLCVPDPDRDAADALAACADPEIRRWNPGPDDLAAARTWCAQRADWSDGTHASWVVRDAGTAALLGSVSLNQIVASQRECDVGYWVAPAARRSGVATAAVSAATRFGFEVLDLHRIQLYHSVRNLASCRTANAAGYLLEGTLRESYRYGDGEFHDEHAHARLSTD